MSETAPITAREALELARHRCVQALHAGISRRDWHATEIAANELRDRIDALLISPALSVQPAREGLREALQLARSGIIANGLDLPHTMAVIDAALSAAPAPVETDALTPETLLQDVRHAASRVESWSQGAAPAPVATGERATVWLIERQDLEPGRTHYYCEPAPRRHDWTLDVHAARKFTTKKEALAEASGADGLSVREHIFGLGYAAPAPVETGWRLIDGDTPRDREIIVWAPSYQDLPAIASECRWHPDAGFCICELRSPTHWIEAPAPSTREG